VAKKQVVLVLDETGSMGIIRDHTISGFNEYKNSLKDVLFTLVQFNKAKIEMVHNRVPVKDVPDLDRETYTPTDLTPLYDAIGSTMTDLKGKKGVFVIMTDGQENASVEYSQQQIFDMVTEKRKKGWEVVFLGADQDAWATGQVIGVSKGSTMSYDKAKIVETFTHLGVATARSLSGEDGDFWKNKDREDLK